MGLYMIFFSSAAVKSSNPIKVGILGAAKIAPFAYTNPLSHLSDGIAYAVAARDIKRAEAFAKLHSIPVVHPTYEALIEDPDIDAVYIPLPNGVHEEWCLKAIQAGKHVLCEKPLTSNAEQAKAIQRELVGKPGLVFAEAFHWKAHPLALFLQRVLLGEEAREGFDLGKVTHVESTMILPGIFFSDNDIRFNFDLAGG
jgi:predicted dehydrogenase